MPGNVALAAPTTVMPASLSTVWVETLVHEIWLSGPYVDNRSQRTHQTTTSRRFWQLTKRLTASQVGTLETFYDNRKGATEPFYFYPLLKDYDPTGMSPTGRVTARFDGNLERAYSVGRREVTLKIAEIS